MFFVELFCCLVVSVSSLWTNVGMFQILGVIFCSLFFWGGGGGGGSLLLFFY